MNSSTSDGESFGRLIEESAFRRDVARRIEVGDFGIGVEIIEPLERDRVERRRFFGQSERFVGNRDHEFGAVDLILDGSVFLPLPLIRFLPVKRRDDCVFSIVSRADQRVAADEARFEVAVGVDQKAETVRFVGRNRVFRLEVEVERGVVAGRFGEDQVVSARLVDVTRLARADEVALLT